VPVKNSLLANPRAKAKATKGTLYLYDAIGDDGWGGGISASQVVDALKELKTAGHSELEVRISSPGGSVFDGIAMYRAISEWDGPKTAIVDGLAASAASFVMLAADKVQAGAEAMIMVHEAWGGLFASGTADDIIAAAEALATPLRKANDSIVSIYVQRTGLDEKKCRALMAAETWMTGEEAKAEGFVSEVLVDDRETVGAGNVTESAAAIIATFKNAPAAVKSLLRSPAVMDMEARQARREQRAQREVHNRLSQAIAARGVVPGKPGDVSATPAPNPRPKAATKESTR
jgi:ATP-dependent Clp protease protease subunit